MDASDEIDVRARLQMDILNVLMSEDRKHDTKTTPGAIRTLTELICQYVQHSLVPDLHSFSNHGNRKSTIAPEDVALILRKLPDIQEQFQTKFGGNVIDHNSNNHSSKRTKATTDYYHHRPMKATTANLPSSSSSSSSDDDSLEFSSISRVKDTRDMPPPSKRAKKKAVPTFAERQRQVAELMESSSDEELFFKSSGLAQKKKAPTGSSKASQVVEIMKNLSPDSCYEDNNEDDEQASLDGDKSIEEPSRKVKGNPRKAILSDTDDEDE